MNLSRIPKHNNYFVENVAVIAQKVIYILAAALVKVYNLNLVNSFRIDRI